MPLRQLTTWQGRVVADLVSAMRGRPDLVPIATPPRSETKRIMTEGYDAKRAKEAINYRSVGEQDECLPGQGAMSWSPERG